MALALALASCSPPGTPSLAHGFTLDSGLNNGTPDDPSDDLLDAARWTNLPGSLVEDGVRGMGGGLEYAVADDFCERLLPRFVDEPKPSCGQLREAIQGAFDRWAERHPVLRFVDVSGRIQPMLPPPGVREPWRGFGAEIDLLALSPREYPKVAGAGAWTSFWFVRVRPIGTNGYRLSGNTLTSVDIVVNATACFHLDPSLGGGRCNHLESLVLHETGHALALDHPNQFPERNFDTDGDAANPVELDCQEPTRNLMLSPNIDPLAVMNSSRGQPEPVHPQLTHDDLAGRDFLYPVCGPGEARSLPSRREF